MEVINKLNKNSRECCFCGCGHCPSTPVTIKPIVKGKPTKLNTYISEKELDEIWGEEDDIL